MLLNEKMEYAFALMQIGDNVKSIGENANPNVQKRLAVILNYMTEKLAEITEELEEHTE